MSDFPITPFVAKDPLPQDLIPTNLWEKQSDESARAFSAFKSYRDLHPSIRSLRKAVEVIYGAPVTSGKLRQFAKWSVKYHWVIRATSWDEEKDKQERLVQINSITEANKRHLAIAKTLQGIALNRLKKLSESTDEINEISFDQMMKIIDQSYKMEREVLGMNDLTITETDVEAEEISLITDVSTLSTQELRKRIAQRRLHVSNTNPGTN